ncbi:hypothetical protein CPB85DRAFT_1276127 [Mucidula mucida]|nr:hypothetical protein CPB85DRAFT_1276127 [Mucidula mucida]
MPEASAYDTSAIRATSSNPSVDMPTHSATAPSPIFSADSTSPMFSDFGDDFLTSPQNDFLTSPLFDNFGGDFSDSSPLDTPLDSFLTTPLFHDVGEPLIAGGEEFSRMDLFGGQDIMPAIEQEIKLPPVEKSLSINPSSLTATPARPDDSVFVPPTRTARGTGKPRKASAATGTRKNITPESMVPMDAPIQSRRYITPSATSRKEVPATFLKKKRSRSQAFGEDDEGRADRFKRRQNTLAARKSRKRKLEYQQGLESQIEDLQAQLAHWKARAEVSEGVLQANGLSLPT